MKCLSTLLFAGFLGLSSMAFAQTEPNYYDLTEVTNSLNSIKNSCPKTNPACRATCSKGIRSTMMMDTGTNVTSEQANRLKQLWWSCYNILMKR